MRTAILLLLTAGQLSCAAAWSAERINQEGRILGTQATVTTPTLFDTAAADAIVSTMQIFPVDNAWNEDVSALPLLGGTASPTLSNAMVTQIRNDVYTQQTGQTYANRQRVVVFQEMNYVLVPDAQANINMLFVNYPGESDYNGGTSPIATWPIPTTMPIEGWPTQTGSLTLNQWQEDINNTGGDRHSIVVQPGLGNSFETWQAILTTNTPAWQASNGAIFNLNADTLRPAGWTSGDAAGLPLFPALVRYDEAERGMVEHAMRIVVQRSCQSYLYPATHEAGSTTLAQVPAMGQRIRLKSSYVIPASWSKEETSIALGLKKYGALVADNGGFFSISICPDDRWPPGCFSHLSTGASSDFCDINNFEVVQSTGATTGPRSPGAPTVTAGANQTVTLSSGASLNGTATGSGLTTLWYIYPYATPPGTVSFGNANALSTTANFSAIGTYTLMLVARDGIHAPAFDTLAVTVQSGNNPVPTLAALSPTTVVQFSGSFQLTVTGTGFVANSQVTWTGEPPLVPTNVSATQMTVSVPATYLAVPGAVNVAVTSPTPGGGTTVPQIITITADTTPPVISGVTVTGISATSATVSWTTNELASSQVEYGLTTAYGSSTVLNTLVTTSHSQVISGLTASTAYHFSVVSADQANNTAASVDAVFTTLAVSTAGGAGTAASTGGSSGHGCGLGGLAATLVLSALVAVRLQRCQLRTGSRGQSLWHSMR